MLRQVEQYTLLESVAVSPAGETFRALDKTAGREVLIKIGQSPEAELRVGGNSPALRETDSIATPIEARSLAGGELLLVEQRENGSKLADVIQRYDGDWRQIAHVIRELAIALAFAHEKGLTHGDISADSIVIGEDGVPVLTQFGMGLALNRAADTDAEAREKKLKHDIRADLFALGCVMYQLLSGQTPTDQHPSRLSDPMAEGDDIPPIERTAPEAPTELRAICAQALSTDPIHRYLAAAPLVRDLESYLYGKRSKPMVKIVFITIAAATVGLFGLWGTVGGGPARIAQLSIVSHRAEGDAGAVGASTAALSDGGQSLTTDDRFSVTALLTKSARVSVVYRTPTGEIKQLADATLLAGRQALPIPPDGSGWSTGDRGGVGLILIATHAEGVSVKPVLEGVLAESGPPPHSLAPIVIYGSSLPAPNDPPLLQSQSLDQTRRWKSATQFVDFVERRTAGQFDDLVIALIYVVGA